MDWTEVKHRINMEITKFFRDRGKKANILILGKEEYETLIEQAEVDPCTDSDVHANTMSVAFWGMNVYLDMSKDSFIQAKLEDKSFLDQEEDALATHNHRMKVDVDIPLEFGVAFKSFLVTQNDPIIGVQVLKDRYEILKTVNVAYFQINVVGTGKPLVEAWANYIFEIAEVLKNKAK